MYVFAHPNILRRKRRGINPKRLKLHFGSGWRVYYTERNGQIIILLAGGNKSTQKRDIQLALTLARNL